MRRGAVTMIWLATADRGSGSRSCTRGPRRRIATPTEVYRLARVTESFGGISAHGVRPENRLERTPIAAAISAAPGGPAARGSISRRLAAYGANEEASRPFWRLDRLNGGISAARD